MLPQIHSIYLTLNRLGPGLATMHLSAAAAFYGSLYCVTEGANILADAISFQQRPTGAAMDDNNGLKELYLDSNVLGDVGAIAIAKMLRDTSAEGFRMAGYWASQVHARTHARSSCSG